jgi:hypothetical protein
MSDEQVQELEDNPKEAFPRLAAKLHLEAQLAAVQQITRVLPTMLRHITEQQTQAKTFEDQFFQRWPALSEQYQYVTQVTQMYRAANPAATAKDVIENVGLHAMLSLKLPIPAPPGQIAPVASVAPVVPFSPIASQAAPTIIAAPAQPQNEFALLAEEDMRDAGQL